MKKAQSRPKSDFGNFEIVLLVLIRRFDALYLEKKFFAPFQDIFFKKKKTYCGLRSDKTEDRESFSLTTLINT